MPAALRLLTLVAILALARPVLAFDYNDCPDPLPSDFLTPAPWRPDAPSFLATACVGEPYSQIISIWNPDEFTVGGSTLPLEYSNLPLDGIRDLPAGLSYQCAPSNCVFAGPGAGGSGHSYCIEIFGTPVAANPLPETHDLSFSFDFVSSLGGLQFPVDYPSDLDPDAHVYLNLEPAGNCPEPHATVASVAVLGVLGALARRRVQARADAAAASSQPPNHSKSSAKSIGGRGFDSRRLHHSHLKSNT